MSRSAATQLLPDRGHRGSAKRLRNYLQLRKSVRDVESIKALIPNLFESARPRTAAKGHSSWLATAALLTRVATVHDEMSAGRREKLYALLKAAFQLDDLTVAQLIDQSAEVARNAIDLYRFTRKLREVLDNEGRHQTVRMMWEIAYADGKPNEFEANIIWRAADLLGVSSRQRVALRQLVLADNASFGAGVGGFRREPICNFEPMESKTHG
jgi:uncharacterized tellurite resistance protein B-like protein